MVHHFPAILDSSSILFRIYEMSGSENPRFLGFLKGDLKNNPYLTVLP
jgi:hypothetical protein